ncbi:MAG: HNH endonuclease, partial [Candidatus Gastranaerophilales bacterium]|nr:HNH endonuclease [Candidatus Gastranaerophilales bacterium]
TLIYDFVNPAKLPKEAQEILKENHAITSPQKVYISRLQKGLQGYDLKGKEVHHVNRNTQCNRSSNLIALTPEAHKMYHRGEIHLPSDLVLTLPKKPKKLHKPHKKHISERKIFNIKKYLLFDKSANWIKKELRTDKKTIAEIKNKNLDQLEISAHLKEKLKRLRVKILDLSRRIFNFSPNNQKHAMSNDFNCMYNSITCPKTNNNADTS